MHMFLILGGRPCCLYIECENYIECKNFISILSNNFFYHLLLFIIKKGSKV